MPLQTPLVSVVVPVYNAGQYLGDTINSVLNQTYRNFEIIIVDDGSSDNSVGVIKAFEEKYSNIKLFYAPSAGRPAVPRNIGINNAAGEFIAFLDADDLWTKNKLAAQVDYLLKYSDCPLVYTASKTFGAVNIFSPFYEVLPLPGKGITTRDKLITLGNTITCSSVLARKELLINAGGFDEDPLMRVEDYDLWIRLAEYGDFGFLPCITVHYRVHENQFSGDWDKKNKTVRYLAEKRNLPIPEYRMVRNKGFLLRMIRNLVHLTAAFYYKFRGCAKI